MKTLNIIKTLNNIKKLDNISSDKFDFNFYDKQYKNTIVKREFIYNKTVFSSIFKNNNLIFNLNSFRSNNKFKILFNSYIWNILNIDTYTLEFYRNIRNNRVYSSYNISMLYIITFDKLNENNIKFSKKLANKTLNIRTQFKASNIKLLKKVSMLDIILKKYIETYLDEKVSINFDRYSIKFFNKKNMYVKAIRRKLRRMKKMLKWAKISLRNFIRITLIFLCTKDIEIFSKVLLKIMNSMHYKNHRRFLYYLKLFISKSMNYYFELLRFEGFFFYLSGKISGGGNSKKKNYAVRCGKYSLTNKMLKLKFKKGLIHTKTGVLGYKLMISYS